MSTLLPPSGNGPHLPHGIRPPARSQAPLPPEAASAAAGVKPEKPSWPIVELVMGLMMVVVGLKLPADGALASLRSIILLGICGMIVAYGIYRNPYAPFLCYAFITPISKAFGTGFALMLGGMFLVWLRRSLICDNGAFSAKISPPSFPRLLLFRFLGCGPASPGLCCWRWRFSLPGTAYCLWGLASLFWAGEIFTELDSWTSQALGPMLLAFAVAGLPEKTFRRNLMLLVAAGCSIGTVFSFRNWATGVGEYGNGGRFYALIPPDPFSAWILLGLFGAIAWVIDGGAPLWLRWCLAASIPWQVLGLGLCGFRAAILAAVLGVVMVGICMKRLFKLLGFVTLSAIPVVGVTLLLPGLFDTVMARFGTMGADRGSDRLIIWAGALEKFWNHPIIGYGLDNFKLISRGFYSEEIMPHSIYVGTLVELGLVGAILLLCWLAVLYRKAWRSTERLWVFPMMAAFGFQAMFLHEFYYPCFWLAIALVEGAPQVPPKLAETRCRRPFSVLKPQTRPAGGGMLGQQGSVAPSNS